MARILLVDDNPRLRATARKILALAGHEVVEASDGVEALACYRAAPADLVITDVYMPEGDGIETTIRLTQEFPGIRLVVMSGGGFVDRESILETAGRLGAGGTLPKPFSKEQLLAAVDAALQVPAP